MRGHIPYITGMAPALMPLNPRYCAWCNAVLMGRMKRERNPAGVLDFSQRSVAAGVCPDCGSSLFAASGCVSCPSCGWEKC